MEREKAWPDTAAPPGRREGESLTSESGGIEYRCGCAGGLARSSGEVPAVAVGVKRRGQVIRGMFVRSTGLRSGRSRVSELKSSGKPFEISKAEVWQAWEKVKDNKGAPGVDGCYIEDFEADLKNNLYKIWNRMSSGSYFPPPVRAVEIPKPHGGGTRMLGVPCVSDRVAQTVVARRLCEHERGKRGNDGRSRRSRGLRCWTSDGGCLALRSRRADGGSKPPRGALVNDRRLERRGKRRGCDRVRCGPGR